MANATGYTKEAALITAADIQAALALGKIRVFDNTLNPGYNTVKADFVGAEIVLTGMPVGGYTVTAMHDPQAAPAGGMVLLSPLVVVAYASGPAASAGGWWYEDAGGVVRQYTKFEDPVTLASVGDAVDIVAQFGYGGPSQV